MTQTKPGPVLSTAFPARFYVEPTNACNLSCRTCVRNAWQERPSWMRMATFDRILASVRSLAPRPLVFFGGFGEPLVHPRIVEMVHEVRKAGAPAELITNGVFLSPRMIGRLAEAGLDRVWVSMDGATPESYTDVRLGAALPRINENLSFLREQQSKGSFAGLRLGISFVAMRRNLADLPAVVRMGRQFGADRFSISNVLAYTSELQAEILYQQSLYRNHWDPYRCVPGVDLPPMDTDDEIKSAIGELLAEPADDLSDPLPGVRKQPVCPFLEKGSVSIRWDGEVAPCLPLMYGHSAYLDDRLRRSIEVSYGNLVRQPLLEIWRSQPYQSFRDRLAAFDFSPCVTCNACEMADSNLEDCFGNVHPACGGCLWAEGFIRCP